jgi:hypothetical protein
MQTKSVALALTLILGGCGFGGWGPRFASYDDVPANRTRLYVYRSSQWFTQDVVVRVDGRTLADLSPGTYVEVLLVPRAAPLSYKVTAELPFTISPKDSPYRPTSTSTSISPLESDLRVRRVEAHPGSAVFCGLTFERHLIPIGIEFWWTCSDEPSDHEELKSCRQAAPDESFGH